MAGTDYTDKQIAEHMAQFEKDGTLPENSVFNPAGFARGEPILRKMTPDEIKEHGVTAKPDEKEDKD
jgi:hypothetical protein